MKYEDDKMVISVYDPKVLDNKVMTVGYIALMVLDLVSVSLFLILSKVTEMTAGVMFFVIIAGCAIAFEIGRRLVMLKYRRAMALVVALTERVQELDGLKCENGAIDITGE